MDCNKSLITTSKPFTRTTEVAWREQSAKVTQKEPEENHQRHWNGSVTSWNLTVTNTVFQPKSCNRPKLPDKIHLGITNKIQDKAIPTLPQHAAQEAQGSARPVLWTELYVRIPAGAGTRGSAFLEPWPRSPSSHMELGLSWHMGILPLVHAQAGTECLRAIVTVRIPSKKLT